jgi:Spondin_N
MRVMRGLVPALLATGAASLLLVPAAMATSREYEVTIENLTAGQAFSPPVAAVHKGKHAIFDVGEPASVGIREIAENGNNAPLVAQLEANPFGRIGGFVEGTAPLVPVGVPGDAMFDQSATLALTAPRNAHRLSLATMLICTNDGFTGLDSIALPHRVGQQKVRTSAGYDAHTEQNTEDYADLVPPCQGLIGDSSGEPGTGNSNPALAEGGVIAHHAGILGGIGDLDPAIHGWTDPVAKVTVKRTG